MVLKYPIQYPFNIHSIPDNPVFFRAIIPTLFADFLPRSPHLELSQRHVLVDLEVMAPALVVLREVHRHLKKSPGKAMNFTGIRGSAWISAIRQIFSIRQIESCVDP